MIKPAVRPTDLTVFREVGGARPSVSTSIMMVARRANPSSCPSNRSLFKGVQTALAAAMRAIPDQDPRCSMIALHSSISSLTTVPCGSGSELPLRNTGDPDAPGVLSQEAVAR